MSEERGGDTMNDNKKCKPFSVWIDFGCKPATNNRSSFLVPVALFCGRGASRSRLSMGELGGQYLEGRL